MLKTAVPSVIQRVPDFPNPKRVFLAQITEDLPRATEPDVGGTSAKANLYRVEDKEPFPVHMEDGSDVSSGSGSGLSGRIREIDLTNRNKEMDYESGSWFYVVESSWGEWIIIEHLATYGEFWPQPDFGYGAWRRIRRFACR